MPQPIYSSTQSCSMVCNTNELSYCRCLCSCSSFPLKCAPTMLPSVDILLIFHTQIKLLREEAPLTDDSFSPLCFNGWSIHLCHIYMYVPSPVSDLESIPCPYPSLEKLWVQLRHTYNSNGKHLYSTDTNLSPLFTLPHLILSTAL